MRNPWSKFNPQQHPSGPARNEGGEIIPDRVSTEPIVGFRSWTVVHDEHGLALKSLNKLWVWDNPSTAECVTPAIWSQQILRHDGVSPDPECACGLYCVTVDTPVLTHDMRWVPAGDLKVGDRLYSIDEQAEHAERYPYRRYTDATVTAQKIVETPVVRIELEDGQSLTCTPDHPVLARVPTTVRGRERGFDWYEAQELTPKFEIPQFFDMWATEASWDAGWLAGMYDGEGYLSNSSKAHIAPATLGIAQKSGPVLKEAIRQLKTRGFDFSKTYNKASDTYQLRLRGGYSEVVRLLGSVRPMRLIEKLGYPQAKPIRKVRVAGVVPAGVQPIAMMSTSARTYITKGFASHNSQLPDHPISEWSAMRKSQVSATGSVALYGRVVVCERGYKAQYARMQSPIVLEAECMMNCEKPAARVHIPSRHLYRYFVSCDEHFRAMDTSEEVTVQVGPWLRLAAEELSERYDVEFLSWSML